jgi:hypothetical protein
MEKCSEFSETVDRIIAHPRPFVTIIRLQIFLSIRFVIQGDQKVSVHLTITVQNTQKYNILNSFNHLPLQNTFGMWTVLY